MGSDVKANWDLCPGAGACPLTTSQTPNDWPDPTVWHTGATLYRLVIELMRSVGIIPGSLEVSYTQLCIFTGLH